MDNHFKELTDKLNFILAHGTQTKLELMEKFKLTQVRFDLIIQGERINCNFQAKKRINRAYKQLVHEKFGNLPRMSLIN